MNGSAPMASTHTPSAPMLTLPHGASIQYVVQNGIVVPVVVPQMPIIMLPGIALPMQPYLLNNTTPFVTGNPLQVDAANLYQQQLMWSSAIETAMADLLSPQGESKQCNCKKSRCLKLYCDCFAAGVICKDCKCTDCLNVPSHQVSRLKAIESKLARERSAFDSKSNLLTKAVASDEHRHNRGCNCKKSGCVKKYCECYLNGIPCGSLCRCQGCKNDGSLLHLRSFGVVEQPPPPRPIVPSSATSGTEGSSSTEQQYFPLGVVPEPYISAPPVSSPAFTCISFKTPFNAPPTAPTELDECLPILASRKRSPKLSDLKTGREPSRKRTKVHRRQPSCESLSTVPTSPTASEGNVLSDEAYSGSSGGPIPNDPDALALCSEFSLDDYNGGELMDLDKVGYGWYKGVRRDDGFVKDGLMDGSCLGRMRQASALELAKDGLLDGSCHVTEDVDSPILHNDTIKREPLRQPDEAPDAHCDALNVGDFINGTACDSFLEDGGDGVCGYI